MAESRIALKRFPDSTVFMFTYHLSRYQKISHEKQLLFNDLLIDRNALNVKKSEEVSLQKVDLLDSLIAKYMFDFRDYNSASKLISRIDDFAALNNLKVENAVLKKLDNIKK